jgi:hypothetical protein
MKMTLSEKRLEQNIRQLMKKITAPGALSREEINQIWKDIEIGFPGRFSSVFPRFAYADYDAWKTVASKQPYAQLHDALQAVDQAALFNAIPLIKKGIKQVYSMGPSPGVDKLFLEELVNQNIQVEYHAVDASLAVGCQRELEDYLTEKFSGEKWKNLVKLSQENLKFEDVKSREPSLVVYSGGTLMNKREYWEQANRIAQPGGIVVGSAALNPKRDNSMGEYWLSIYNTKENRRMILNGLETMLPSLFTKKNRDKWDVEFSYSESTNDSDRWGIYQKPMVQAEIKIKQPMNVKVLDPETGNPVFIKALPSTQRTYPLVALVSSKMSIGTFFGSLPERFGLALAKDIEKPYVVRDIDYTFKGNQGKVGAGIFYATTPRSLPELEPKFSSLRCGK